MNPKAFAAAAGVVALLGVVGAVMLPDDGAGTRRAEDASAKSTSTSTTTAAGQAAPTGQPPAAASSSGSSAGTAPTAETARAPKAASAQSRWQVPAPGTYRYHSRRTGDGAYDWEASLVVIDDGGGKYRESREQQSTMLTRSFTTTAAGALHLTHFAVTSPTATAVCQWDRPLVLLDGDYAEGRQWTSAAACRLPLPSGDADLQIETTWKIVGWRDAKVGDATVRLLRVDGTSTTRTTSKSGTIVKTGTAVNYFDTARGLLAQSTEDATETAPSGATTTYRIVETMLTVEPEVRVQ